MFIAMDDLQTMADIILNRIIDNRIMIEYHNAQYFPSVDDNQYRIEWNDDSSNAYVYISISIGLSVLKSEKLTTNELILDSTPANWIQRANLSLQRAKKRGKNIIGPLLCQHENNALQLKNDINNQWFNAAVIGNHTRIMEMVKTQYPVDSLQICMDNSSSSSSTSDTKLTALMIACIYDHSEVVRTLLRYNANINCVDEYGRTALMHACQNTSLKSCKVLLQNKQMKINICDRTLKSALMYAILQGQISSTTQKCIKICSLLLLKNADVNLQDQQGMSVIMFAIQCTHHASMTMVNLILEYNPDLTLQDEYQQTALMCAAKKNYYNICARMLQSGAQVDNQHSNGLTALMWAAFLGHEAVVDTLMEYNAQINLTSVHGSTALHFACECGHLSVAQLLIQPQSNTQWIQIIDKDGDTCLHCAVCNGHSSIVQMLCQHISLQSQQTTKHKNLLQSFINQRNHNSQNAFDIAKEKNMTDIISILLDKKRAR